MTTQNPEGVLGIFFLDKESWMQRAPCAQTDPEAFFPEKGSSARDAKNVCGRCTVRAACLEYALANDERFGVWGGLSERERRAAAAAAEESSPGGTLNVDHGESSADGGVTVEEASDLDN